ncbi:MAG: rod shape-determining protein RodA [bacterium]|nr:rod shape-determining protein RodA [bacterium]
MRESLRSFKEKMSLIPWAIPALILLISCLGLAVLFSAAGGHVSPWALKQAPRLCVGFLLMILIATFDLRFFLRYAYLFYFLSILLLISVELLGFVGMGAKRWIQVGPLNIQPSEAMKITLVLALARYFHNGRPENVRKLTFLLPPALLALIPMVLVLRQPDLGTTAMIGFVSACLFFAAGIPRWMVITSMATLVGAVPALWPFLHGYQKARILTFLNPESDPLGSGYHILQSKIALGSGGLWGRGFLKGPQNHLNFLPEKQTDFIFTMFCEEWGFIGGVALLFLYGLLISFGYRTAGTCTSTFGRFIALGVTSTLFLYVFVNTAMVMGLLPVVGVPLPFMSYGGTSLMVLLMSYGLLLCAHVHGRQRLGQSAGI